MFCWIFTRAAQMEDHEFTDDVAYCFCWTKKQAIKRFGQLYDDVKPFEVDKVVYVHPKGRYIVAECGGVREAFFPEEVVG